MNTPPSLRGFKMPISNYNTHASRYQEDRFLPRGVKEMSVAKKDYSALAPLLIAGINSADVTEFKRRKPRCTVNGGCRPANQYQKSIATDTSLYDNRVSVVVMLPSTGDVLASAVYPLPPIHNWDLLNMPVSQQNKYRNGLPPAIWVLLMPHNRARRQSVNSPWRLLINWGWPPR